MRSPFLLILCLATLIFSCQKEGDVDPPQITIISPNTGASFEVLDTIIVCVRVQDNMLVESVSARLLYNGIAVSGTTSRIVDQQEAELCLAIEINNVQLTTGDYTIAIRATDGCNDQNEFRTVFVQETALEFKGLVAVSQVGGTAFVHRFDETLNSAIIADFQMDERVTAMNSQDQQFIIGGGVTGDLFALDVDDGNIEWSVANLNTGTLPYFWNGTYVPEDQLVYVEDEDGNIRGRNAQGGVVFSASSTLGYRPIDGWLIDDVFVCMEQLTAGSGYQLSNYFRPSGILQANFPLDKFVVEAFHRQGALGLLFGNRNGDGVVQIFDSQFGPSFEPRTIAGETISDVVQISSELYIIATSASVYRYTYSNNNLLSIVSGLAIRDMDYDLISGAVYIASGSQILAMDPSNGNYVVVGGLGGPAKKVFVVHNK